MKPAYYIGLDLSLRATGFVALDPFGVGLDSRLIKSNEHKEARLVDLIDRLDEAIQCLCGVNLRPAPVVAIEHYAMGAKFQLAQMGEWGGVVREYLYRRGIAFIEVAPTTLKLFATGKGNSKGKVGVALAVMRKYGHEFDDDNLADACVLAHMARSMVTGLGGNAAGPASLTEYERRALEKPYKSAHFQKNFPCAPNNARPAAKKLPKKRVR